MYREYKDLDLQKIHKEELAEMEKLQVFSRSVEKNKDNEKYIFYEGPPSANGLPGIHHVMGRTIKDIFCRFKSLKGYRVDRKAGWDTHGLPVELSVEKLLSITKEDIGEKISVEEYNDECRKNVLKYKKDWELLTKEMGYWVDMENPYITYENKYIESVWWLLKEFYKKGLLYKGFTIQPYSPKAGTGLSTHELNQPGCYKMVKDTSITAQFKIVKNELSNFLFEKNEDIFLLAWTTTPWTLPSNTALAVGKKIDYLKIKTFNKYTEKQISIIIAEDLYKSYFSYEETNEEHSFIFNDKKPPYKILRKFKGIDLVGIKYNQLMNYDVPKSGNAFLVIAADFVTTEDGTGIVHIAPSFGSDDNHVAKLNGIGSLTLVDKYGKFKEIVTDFAGKYVKDSYYEEGESKNKLDVDTQISIKLKKENKAFLVQKYEHSYPHCWRTDKPILYYPLDSWFIKTTAFKKKMSDLNKTINWKPKSTGEGRFGNWLENLVDWNLSRSRYWGVPVPIWRSKDGKHEKCIGSIEELKEEIDLSIMFKVMENNPLKEFIVGDFSDKNYDVFDLHKPYVDNIVLCTDDGKTRLFRELDLIDVWFDSGAMPYAQLHYPFENYNYFKENFPADFIAEGVDQTRGWFFTLHAIATIIFDSVAFKNVISNGLVLDKEGNKMSKRLGNAINPFETIKQYGADATRWYMISNAQPWENLKFNTDGIEEVKRKFFGTLFNTYSFFSLYANIDKFKFTGSNFDIKTLDKLDKWILSELNTLILECSKNFDAFEPTKVCRDIQFFVVNKLSNWYVRLSRRKFWKGEYNESKISAYQTLYECLEKIAIISSPIIPFYSNRLFNDLNKISKRHKIESVHLTSFPHASLEVINKKLENQMSIAQEITSMILSLRKQEKIRVRQPLPRALVPVNDKLTYENIMEIKTLVEEETNIKELKVIDENSGFFAKRIKPNFKTLGPKYGKEISKVVSIINQLDNKNIELLEKNKSLRTKENITLLAEDIIITSENNSGLPVISNTKFTVALDTKINDTLKNEGVSRELVNRIQILRKERSLEVTDKINIEIQDEENIQNILKNNLNYICNETLCENISFCKKVENYSILDLIENISVKLKIESTNVKKK